MLIAHVFCLFVCSGCPTQCGYGWRQCIGIRTVYWNKDTVLWFLILGRCCCWHRQVLVTLLCLLQTRIHLSTLHHTYITAIVFMPKSENSDIKSSVWVPLYSTAHILPLSLPPPPPLSLYFPITNDSWKLVWLFFLYVQTWRKKKTPLNKLLVKTGSNKKKETRTKVSWLSVGRSIHILWRTVLRIDSLWSVSDLHKHYLDFWVGSCDEEIPFYKNSHQVFCDADREV